MGKTTFSIAANKLLC